VACHDAVPARNAVAIMGPDMVAGHKIVSSLVPHIGLKPSLGLAEPDRVEWGAPASCQAT